MVPRSDLVAASRESKAAREEVNAAVSRASILEEQLVRVKEQISSAQAAMATMVPRFELIAAKERVAEMDAKMRASEERQRRLSEELKEQVLMHRNEIDDLKSLMQASLLFKVVMFPCRNVIDNY